MRIITDSTCDLSQEMVELYNIEIVPLTVILKDRQYKDGLDIETQTLFDYVKGFGELPKTSAASVADFIEVFQGKDEIVYLSTSSKLSATFQNASLAAKEVGVDHIHLIDSLNLSTGMGLLAIKAAELRNLGKSAEEIESAIHTLVPKVRTSFVIDTLEYLYLGGRCSAMTNIAGSVMRIRPVIEVKPDGTLGVKNKIRGSRDKALQSLVDTYTRDLPNIDLHRVFLTHTGCLHDAYWLKGELRKVGQPDQIYITTAGAVIASHCGPDTIGLLYLLK